MDSHSQPTGGAWPDHLRLPPAGAVVAADGRTTREEMEGGVLLSRRSIGMGNVGCLIPTRILPACSRSVHSSSTGTLHLLRFPFQPWDVSRPSPTSLSCMYLHVGRGGSLAPPHRHPHTRRGSPCLSMATWVASEGSTSLLTLGRTGANGGDEAPRVMEAHPRLVPGRFHPPFQTRP